MNVNYILTLVFGVFLMAMYKCSSKVNLDFSNVTIFYVGLGTFLLEYLDY